MRKSELIGVLKGNQKHLHLQDIHLGVNLLLGYLVDNLANGKNIEIRGFGGFSLHHLPPRNAHNPRTGEKTVTKDKYKAHFKPGKDLKQRVNNFKEHYNIESDYDDDYE